MAIRCGVPRACARGVGVYFAITGAERTGFTLPAGGEGISQRFHARAWALRPRGGWKDWRLASLRVLARWRFPGLVGEVVRSRRGGAGGEWWLSPVGLGAFGLRLFWIGVRPRSADDFARDDDWGSGGNGLPLVERIRVWWTLLLDAADLSRGLVRFAQAVGAGCAVVEVGNSSWDVQDA